MKLTGQKRGERLRPVSPRASIGGKVLRVLSLGFISVCVGKHLGVGSPGNYLGGDEPGEAGQDMGVPL